MDSAYIISQLEINKNVFGELLNEVPEKLIRWRPQPDKWNLLEIICHLYDEEREDFRARLKHVFEKPSEPFPPIDPPGWVLSRNYDSKNFRVTVDNFMNERIESVKWLRSLQSPPWNNAYVHPKFGPISGVLLLSNWLAHDYLHMRQIEKVKYDYLGSIADVGLDYAGTW